MTMPQSDLPNICDFSITIKKNDNEEIKLILFVIEFANAIFASIYDSKPRLGSISLGYFIENSINQYQLFGGKNGDLSDAISMIIAKKSNKMTYASVYLENSINIGIEYLKPLIAKYIDSKSNVKGSKV